MPRGWACGKNQPKWHRSLYHRWYDMWTRCRNSESSEYNSYKDCKIDERYRYFSNYVDDIMQLENFDKLCENPSKWSIDKDKIDPNNRCYYFEHLTIMTRSANSKEQTKRNGTLKTPRSVIGISINTGSILVFDSVQQVEIKGFNHSHVSSCCQGKRSTHGGHKWYYLNIIEL